MHVLCVAIIATTLAQTPASAPQSSHAQECEIANWISSRLTYEDKLHVRLLTTSVPPADKQELAAASARFWIPSCSRAIELDRQIPRRVRGSNLHYIDLRDLEWDLRDFLKVMRRYPYAEPDHHNVINPLVIRAEWLVHELSDASVNKSDSYYRLLWGGENIPATRDDFFKLNRVDRHLQKGFELSFSEGKSGVAVNRKRMLDFFDAPHGYVWGTRDAIRIDARTDPLEHPNRDQEHDAEELIAALPKRSAKYGVYGSAMAFLLTDGKGKRVDVAGTDVVIDHTKFKGLPSIRNPGSCVQCHERGPNDTTENEVVSLFKDGIPLTSDKHDYKVLERTLLTDIRLELKRNQEDFATFVKVCNPGLAVEQNAAAFQGIINWYGFDVTLEQAARESYCTPGELRLAIGWAGKRGFLRGARISMLAEGRPMLRTSWEAEFLKAQWALRLWRKGK